MNTFKRISAIILALCAAAAIFTSCSNNEKITSENSTTVASEIQEKATENQTVTVNVTDKNGNVSESVIFVTPATKTVSVATVSNSKYAAVTQSKPKKTTAATTKKPVINDTVNEKAVGISLLTKSDPVQIGNHATVVIQGAPGKTYSIDFFANPSKAATYNDLENKKADANGFVSWSFKIPSSCDLGKRKVIIKEENSSNYIETSITIK